MTVQVFNQVIEGCKRCDVGVDPLDIPSVSCGHERYENAMQHNVELVPKRDYDEVVQMLLELVEDESEPCSFDHHGYCQEHGWFATDPACVYRRARKVLGLDDD